jgi:probable rRNA maturation factor
MNKVSFFNADAKPSYKSKAAAKKLILNLFNSENMQLKNLKYIFCSDEYLLEINKQYLNHNTLTDIITFPLSEHGNPVSGEIYISIPRVKENAEKYKVEYQTELLRVIIHGALHLCGYSDKNKTQIKQMRSKEDYYLAQMNVPREALF